MHHLMSQRFDHGIIISNAQRNLAIIEAELTMVGHFILDRDRKLHSADLD